MIYPGGHCYPPFEQPGKEVDKHQVSNNEPNIIEDGCKCGRLKMSFEFLSVESSATSQSLIDLFCCIKH